MKTIKGWRNQAKVRDLARAERWETRLVALRLAVLTCLHGRRRRYLIRRMSA